MLPYNFPSIFFRLWYRDPKKVTPFYRNVLAKPQNGYVIMLTDIYRFLYETRDITYLKVYLAGLVMI